MTFLLYMYNLGASWVYPLPKTIDERVIIRRIWLKSSTRRILSRKMSDREETLFTAVEVNSSSGLSEASYSQF